MISSDYELVHSVQYKDSKGEIQSASVDMTQLPGVSKTTQYVAFCYLVNNKYPGYSKIIPDGSYRSDSMNVIVNNNSDPKLGLRGLLNGSNNVEGGAIEYIRGSFIQYEMEQNTKKLPILPISSQLQKIKSMQDKIEKLNSDLACYKRFSISYDNLDVLSVAAAIAATCVVLATLVNPWFALLLLILPLYAYVNTIGTMDLQGAIETHPSKTKELIQGFNLENSTKLEESVKFYLGQECTTMIAAFDDEIVKEALSSKRIKELETAKNELNDVVNFYRKLGLVLSIPTASSIQDARGIPKTEAYYLEKDFGVLVTALPSAPPEFS